MTFRSQLTINITSHMSSPRQSAGRRGLDGQLLKTAPLQRELTFGNPFQDSGVANVKTLVCVQEGVSELELRVLWSNSGHADRATFFYCSTMTEL